MNPLACSPAFWLKAMLAPLKPAAAAGDRERGPTHADALCELLDSTSRPIDENLPPHLR